MDEIKSHKQTIEAEIIHTAAPYALMHNLIRSVPGFSSDPMTAIALTSEIGVDMSVFKTAKHLCSWAGCCPRNDSSGGKRKGTRISRAGSTSSCSLFRLLMQSSNRINILNLRSATEGSRPGAATRKPLSVFVVCSCPLSGTFSPNLNPTTLAVISLTAKLNLQKRITTVQALNLLRLRGYVIKDDPVPALA
jgi:hypothetical protein